MPQHAASEFRGRVGRASSRPKLHRRRRRGLRAQGSDVRRSRCCCMSPRAEPRRMCARPPELSPPYLSPSSRRDPEPSTSMAFVRRICAWALTSLGPSNRPRHDSRGLKEACGGCERAQRARGWWGRSRAGRANSSVIKFRFSAHLLFAHGALSPAAWPAGGSSRPARAPEFSWRRLASAWLRSKTRRMRVVSAGNVVRVVSGGPPAGERAPCAKRR